MSWTDPCIRCNKHRTDCECKEGYSTFLPKSQIEKIKYDGVDLVYCHTCEQTVSDLCDDITYCASFINKK